MLFYGVFGFPLNYCAKALLRSTKTNLSNKNLLDRFVDFEAIVILYCIAQLPIHTNYYIRLRRIALGVLRE